MCHSLRSRVSQRQRAKGFAKSWEVCLCLPFFLCQRSWAEVANAKTWISLWPASQPPCVLCACLEPCFCFFFSGYVRRELRGHVLKFITLHRNLIERRSKKKSSAWDLSVHQLWLHEKLCVLNFWRGAARSCVHVASSPFFSLLSRFRFKSSSLEGSIIYHFGRFLKFIIAFCHASISCLLLQSSSDTINNENCSALTRLVFIFPSTHTMSGLFLENYHIMNFFD